MNLLATLADNEVVTVRGLMNKHQNLRLKQGLLDAKVAEDNHQLHRIPDEMIVWDEEGNVVFIKIVNGCWTQPVIVRTPNDPTKGSIVASLNDTKQVYYNPVSTIQKVVGEAPVEVVENNVMHFYRSTHPDTMPYLSISPLWLAVPAFQNLLATFSEGDYSALDAVTYVREPKCNITTLLPLSTRQKYPQNVFPAYFENQIA